MSTEPAGRSEQRLAWLVIVAALALLVVLAAAAFAEQRASWRGYQQRYAALPKVVHAASGIQQLETCDGEVERCGTCHLGAARPELDMDGIPLPFRGHGPILEAHRNVAIGCTACHGGNGRAVTVAAAHVAQAGGGRDPLRREPFVQASCARCHVPGSTPGQERLVEGAELFLGIGCALCHSLSQGGLGGIDYGPDLRTVGRRSPDFFKRKLFDPTATFPESTMPSFRLALEKEPAALQSLLVYLSSLPLSRSAACSERLDSEHLVQSPCTVCHAGAGGRAVGRMVHRCVYILSRVDELRCGACHSGGVPRNGPGNGLCPVVRKHKDACEVCHDAR